MAGAPDENSPEYGLQPSAVEAAQNEPMEQQEQGPGDVFCYQGRHMIKDSSAGKFVDTGPCEDPKHQVVQAAQQAQQAAQGKDQQGTALQGDSLAPSQILNQLLGGAGDKQSIF